MALRTKILPLMNALTDSTGWICPVAVAKAMNEPNEPIGITLKRVRRQFKVLWKRGVLERTRVGTWKMLRPMTEADIPFQRKTEYGEI
jgi:hypothetical protein